MEQTDLIWHVKRESLRKLISDGKRVDERKFDEYRKIELSPNYISSAEGSCLVKLGKTQVLAGVKMGIMEPYPDQPENGVLITSAELGPIASPEFYAGPPSENAIEIARVVDRGLRESKMIDLDALCITPKEKVWAIMVDLHMLDNDGNLIDAASIAAVKALLNTMMPKYEDEKVIRGEKDKKLPVKDKPVSSTFVNINGRNVLDPILEEIKIMDSRMTFVTTQNGNLCAGQKGGTGHYTKKDIDEMFDIALTQGKKVRKLL
jgi:exosome complex component RRP42